MRDRTFVMTITLCAVVLIFCFAGFVTADNAKMGTATKCGKSGVVEKNAPATVGTDKMRASVRCELHAQALPRTAVPQPPTTSWDTVSATFKTYCDEGYYKAGQSMGLGEDEYAAARRAFIGPLLQALKVLQDNEVPKERLSGSSFPTVIVYDFIPSDPSSPKQQEAERRYQESMDAQRQASVLDDMIAQRAVLISNIGGYYVKAPYAAEELRQIATQILQSKDSVAEVMSKAEPYIPTSNTAPSQP